MTLVRLGLAALLYCAAGVVVSAMTYTAWGGRDCDQRTDEQVRGILALIWPLCLIVDLAIVLGWLSRRTLARNG